MRFDGKSGGMGSRRRDFATPLGRFARPAREGARSREPTARGHSARGPRCSDGSARVGGEFGLLAGGNGDNLDAVGTAAFPIRARAQSNGLEWKNLSAGVYAAAVTFNICC